ncbi:MAG: aminotransferase class III-fold pyridoxal phosphate-dependent enzyme, partial [Candidatus Eremiobacteraeota bacterium]|nr:aminotransferase class III-fold pyridoxal phosphate-dependent enzyme [Candidatus Eremiobacteraeota bacterium]
MPKTNLTEDPAVVHARHVLTPWVAQGNRRPPTIERGEGCYLYDDRGKRYLDFSSGLVAVNLGHGHAGLAQAIGEQAARLGYASPTFGNEKRAALAQAIAELGPWEGEGRIFFTTGGGEANEDAVKFARVLTGRHKVLTAYRSFHGSAPGAGTLTGENRRWPNDPGIPGVVRFFAPFPYRSPFFTRDPDEERVRAIAHLDEIVRYEGGDRIAALLIEPVVGSNGVIVPPPGYLAGLRALCDEFGIILILDEVMTGFGRTGAAFGAQRFDVVPDMITFAKGVTSAYAPLGGVLVRESLARTYDTKPLGTGHTYSGHPLAMAAALGAIAAYQEGGYFERGRLIEQWLRTKLGALKEKYALIGDVRGAGAFFALEFVADRERRTPLVAWQG